MQSRRPVPLSDELLVGPVLLGSRCFSTALPVKNTFVDMPSGFTPTSMKDNFREPLLTAPAGLQKKIALSPGSDFFPALMPQELTSHIAGTACSMSSSGTAAKEESSAAPIIRQLAEDFETKEALTSPMDMMQVVVGEDEAEDEEEDRDDSDEEASGLHLSAIAAPAPPPGALHPSVGSEGHASGVCKRCCFFPRGRCANGYDCTFCHYEHERRKRSKRKTKAARTLQTAARALQTKKPTAQAIAPPTSLAVQPRVSVQPMMYPYSARQVVTGSSLLHPAALDHVMYDVRGCYLVQPYPLGHVAQGGPVAFGPATAFASPSMFASSLAYRQNAQVVRLTPACSEMRLLP